MSDFTEVKAGDEVVVSGRYVRTGRAVVKIVGRKYFYLEGDGRDIPYQKTDGTAKKDAYGSQSWCETPWEHEARKYREDLLAKLREHGVKWTESWAASEKTWIEKKFTDARLRELLVLVECVAADQPVDRL